MSSYGSDKARRLLAMVEAVPGARSDVIEAGLALADDVIDRMRESARSGGASSEIRLAHPQFTRDGRRYVLSVRALRGGIPIMCIVAADLCYAMLRTGLRTRGALVIGDATHTLEGVSGSAVAEALTLMRAQSLPRVAVSATAELLLRQFWEPSPVDTDGSAFVNVFRGRMGGHNIESNERIRALIEADDATPTDSAWLLAQMRAATVQLSSRPGP